MGTSVILDLDIGNQLDILGHLLFRYCSLTVMHILYITNCLRWSEDLAFFVD